MGPNRWRRYALWFAVVAASGCVSTHEVTPQSVSGTFSGVTADGRQLVLTLQQADVGFSGHGTIDGDAFVVSGSQAWTGVGSITYADGSFSQVTLVLSGDSNTLSLEPVGQSPLTLSRGGAQIAPVAGPFSGRYTASGEGLPLAAVTVVQNGGLITGVGRILGQAAGITGATTGANTARGVITFVDESRASFDAELSADGQTMTIRGLGAPLVLQKG